MARDKLITIRIEGEKRQAFGDLAKSQNTDTASLLYDFINQCLSGTLDISLVTGKGNRLDKIDNQLDSERIDKLETDTQRLDHWIGALSERLNDWILRSDRRLTDCEKELSDKITSLEHRLNALAIQQDRQQIDSIDTDSQQDRQGETPDTEPLIKEALRLDFMDDQSLVDAIESQIEEAEKDEAVDESDTSLLPNQETVETVETIEPDKGAIGPVTGDSPQPKNQLSEAVTIGNKPWYTIDDLLDCHYPGWPKTKEGLRKKALTECWPRRTRRGNKGNPYEYQAILPN
jgi:hypothetical protein